MERFINSLATYYGMALLGYKKGEKSSSISIIAIVAILGILGMIIGYYFYQQQNKIAEPYYQSNPSTWIEKKEGAVKEINVDKITKGEGFVDSNGQQYITQEIGTVFNYNGWYQGKGFRREFRDNNGSVIMQINYLMKPDDGIIEGFIVERIMKENNEDKPIIYIFLDEDWKKSIATKVYYGKRFENEMEFDFARQVSEGIYMNEVLDDPGRFNNNYATHYGGVIVGDFRDDENSTIIQFS